MAHLKFLGIYFQEAEGVMAVQGRALEKTAMRVLGSWGAAGYTKEDLHRRSH